MKDIPVQSATTNIYRDDFQAARAPVPAAPPKPYYPGTLAMLSPTRKLPPGVKPGDRARAIGAMQGDLADLGFPIQRPAQPYEGSEYFAGTHQAVKAVQDKHGLPYPPESEGGAGSADIKAQQLIRQLAAQGRSWRG